MRRQPRVEENKATEVIKRQNSWGVGGVNQGTGLDCDQTGQLLMQDPIAYPREFGDYSIGN